MLRGAARAGRRGRLSAREFRRSPPHAARGLALLLDRLGEDGRAAAAHTAASTTIPWAGEGLINLLAGDHDEVREQVRGFFLDVDRRLAGPAADRVHQASAGYLAADRQAAAALAELGPPPTSPVAGPGPESDAFADRADPVRRLRPPADHEATYPHQPHWSDLASPGALLRDAIWGVTGAAAGLVIGAFTLTRIYTVVRGIMLLLDAVALGRSAIAAEASAIGSFGRIDTDVALPVLPTS